MECSSLDLTCRLVEVDLYLNLGPLTYLTVGGQGILVINTHRVAADLFDRRGHIYSDRPRMISKCRQCLQPLPTADHYCQCPMRSSVVHMRCLQ